MKKTVTFNQIKQHLLLEMGGTPSYTKLEKNVLQKLDQEDLVLYLWFFAHPSLRNVAAWRQVSQRFLRCCGPGILSFLSEKMNERTSKLHDTEDIMLLLEVFASVKRSGLVSSISYDRLAQMIKQFVATDLSINTLRQYLTQSISCDFSAVLVKKLLRK